MLANWAPGTSRVRGGRAGRQDRLAVLELLAVVEGHRLCGRIDGSHRCAEERADIMRRVPLIAAQSGIGRVRALDHHLLRQIRAVVGGSRIGADESDRGGVTGVSQRFDDGATTDAGTDDDCSEFLSHNTSFHRGDSLPTVPAEQTRHQECDCQANGIGGRFGLLWGSGVS
jgi:hypothetical protein